MGIIVYLFLFPSHFTVWSGAIDVSNSRIKHSLQNLTRETYVSIPITLKSSRESLVCVSLGPEIAESKIQNMMQV